MEVAIRNSQRLIRINRRKIGRATRKALIRLLGKTPADTRAAKDVEVGILFVNDRRMRALNRRYRGMDKTTDVLSFPQQEFSPPLPRGVSIESSLLLGDIVISLPQAARQAVEYGAPLQEELERLIIHGLLHLAGYDHEKGGREAALMRRMEVKLAEALCP